MIRWKNPASLKTTRKHEFDCVYLHLLVFLILHISISLVCLQDFLGPLDIVSTLAFGNVIFQNDKNPKFEGSIPLDPETTF